MTKTLGELFPPDDGPILLDGAMGTELRARGWSLDELTLDANLARLDLVESIHAQHVAAGSRLILTNTFAATLDERDDTQRDRITPGVEAARRAARTQTDTPVRVAGSLAGWNIASHLTRLHRAIDALAAAEVDALVFETINTPDDVQAALDAAHTIAPSLPVVISFTTTDGSPAEHRRARDVADQVAASGADLGLNCGCGPTDILRLAEQLPVAPVWLKPNTGRNDRVDDAAMAAFVRDALASGARFIGGCCGTTPRTLQTMAAAMTR